MMPINLTKFFLLFLSLFLLNLHAKYIEPEYKLEMNLSKSSLFLGENLILSLKLQYKGLEDYTILEPKIEGMQVQEIADREYKTQDNKRINIIDYKLTPQRSGHFIIAPQSAKIEFLTAEYNNLNNRYKYLQKRTTLSNKVKLEVQSLPNDIKVTGHYRLDTSISTESVKKGEPISYTLILKGEGNLHNLDNLDLKIQGVTIYAKSASRTKNIYEKTFELLADKSYLIPPYSLKYFDSNSHKVIHLRSNSYEVIIDNKPLRKKEKKGLNMIEKSIYFSAGILTLLIIQLSFKVLKNFQYKKRIPEAIRILQKIDDAETFFKKVIPYLDRDRRLNHLIYKLEIVKRKEFKKLKKEIISIIEQYH